MRTILSKTRRIDVCLQAISHVGYRFCDRATPKFGPLSDDDKDNDDTQPIDGMAKLVVLGDWAYKSNRFD